MSETIRDDFSGLIEPGSREAQLLDRIDMARLPRHIAVIMDGNGRWARKRLLPRVAGHRAGVDAVREMVETCARLGIEYLTLYAFSVENWKRPAFEIEALMTFLKEYLRREIDGLERNRIRFRTIGRTGDLDQTVREELEHVISRTASNAGMTLNVALNYGGRVEIVDAFRALLEECLREGRDPASVGDRDIERHLYTAGMADPDLLIRTSGELRVSNFLLWQIAYSELYVTETLWPDFRRTHLLSAIIEYQKRDRRYGGLTESQLAVNRN